MDMNQKKEEKTWLCQGKTELQNYKHNKAYMTFVFHHSLSTFHRIRHLVILHTQLPRVQTVGVQN